MFLLLAPGLLTTSDQLLRDSNRSIIRLESVVNHSQHISLYFNHFKTVLNLSR